MPYAVNGDARLYWDSKGTGTPVLLVMGATYSSRMWYPVIDTLAERHRVIYFDNRGIGKSSAVRTGSIQDMAADAVAVLDAAGEGRAHVYGVSLGGVVVLQLALQSPERVRSLILGCTGILSGDKRRAPRLLNALCYLPAGARLRLIRLLRGGGGYGSAATAEAVAQDVAVLRADSASRVGLLQQQNALRAYSVEPPTVAALDLPALVLHGTEDNAVAYEAGVELASTLPSAELVSLEGAGHNYFLAYRDRANDEVLGFIGRVDAAERLDQPVGA